MQRPTLFKSFWQAGFECSSHTLKTGERLDMVSASLHDSFTEADFARLNDFGMLTVREGLRWHLIESTRGHYDFDSANRMMEAAQLSGVQVVWDLLHFGWPAHFDVFSPGWRAAFADFASAFGRLLKRETREVPIVAPINEISFLSWAGGDVAYLNPFEQGRGRELKRQLVRGAIQASDALRAELPDVRLVAPEPAIHIAGDPMNPADVREAAEYSNSMFEAWDMLSGHMEPELGGGESYLDVLGVNYYDRNQWWNHGKTIQPYENGYRPLRDILTEIYTRYERPIFISETGAEDDKRPHWLAYLAGEVRAARRVGTPIEGICLYPIVNHPGWDDQRHCHNGLWDYAGPDGRREIYEPLAQELLRQARFQRENYEPYLLSNRSAGPDLSLSPALELRFPASAALDEQICP